MNMGERGEIQEYYGGDDSDPIYLDDGEGKDVGRDDDSDSNGVLSRYQTEVLSRYGYPDIKRAVDHYRMNHLVRMNKRVPDNYRMNHLVRFVDKRGMVKRSTPGYLTRQLRSTGTNVWSKILNRI